MSFKFSCDCCSAAIDVPNYRGTIRQAHYCDTCVAEVDAVLHERDAIHTETANLFKTKWEAVKSVYREKHPNAKLPDE